MDSGLITKPNTYDQQFFIINKNAEYMKGTISVESDTFEQGQYEICRGDTETNATSGCASLNSTIIQGDDDVGSTGTIGIAATGAPSATGTGTRRRLMTGEVEFVIEPNELLSIVLTLYTDGLMSKTHKVLVNVDAKFWYEGRFIGEALAHLSDTKEFDFTVTSEPVAENSFASVSGDDPIMGEKWGTSQVRIYPFDSDNQPIVPSTANGACRYFDVVLQNEKRTVAPVACSMEPDPATCVAASNEEEAHCCATCVISNMANERANPAGRYEVLVEHTNPGDVLNGTYVDMWCPPNYYEDTKEKTCDEDSTCCYECGVGDQVGAICSEPWPDESGVQQTFNDYDEDVRSGTTKDRIRLKDSYWRADFDEDHIYQCGLEQACRAKEKCGNGNCATAGNSICKLGYQGPFCGTCSSGYYMNTKFNTCDSCDDAGSFVPVYIFAAVVAAIVIGAVVYYWQKNKEIEQRLEEIQSAFDQKVESARNVARAAFVAAVSKKRADSIHRLQRMHEIVKKLCINKLAILVYTFQVVNQYSNIVTGYEFEFQYPEPAKSMVNWMSAFSFNLITVSPPECVNQDSNYYTRLAIGTLVPLIMVAVGVAGFRIWNKYHDSEDRNFEAWAFVFAFLEFVLSGVSTIICKTFVCDEIHGAGSVLSEQPMLSCDHEGNPLRVWWVMYASFMFFVYPVGVPLLIFVLMFKQRDKIRRVMYAKKCLEMQRFVVDEHMTREERARSAELFHRLQSSGDDEATIEDIAQSDTLMRHENGPRGDDAAARLPTLASETRSREHAARHPMHMPLSPSRALVQLPSSKMLGADHHYEASRNLFAIQHLFEKYEGDTYWYGVYLMATRLLETSILVFFKKRTTKSMVATGIAVLSLTIAQKYKPWLRDSDDEVAEFASWVLFMWLFALMAHDGLSGVPPWLWGTPLVLVSLYFVFYTARACYRDITALQLDLDDTHPENLPSSHASSGSSPAREGRRDDDDADDAEGTDGAPVITPSAGLVAAHEELAMAQEEAARIAKKLAELETKKKAMTTEHNHLNEEHDVALARIDDARDDLKEQRRLAHVHAQSAHDVENMPASVDPDDLPVIDGRAVLELDVMNCGVDVGCLGVNEAYDNTPALAIA